jgi:hypothetical protein
MTILTGIHRVKNLAQWDSFWVLLLPFSIQVTQAFETVRLQALGVTDECVPRSGF